ncbi:MarR family winged helix-turn-helix transcriptional regulator [Amycolatopsis pithecellobii]|uniref:Winged helix DNA-binding protein n=1 Tax=Amycolatopsis pithecellobii TaxID=664692 RepID=A0A6N7YM73_9PSEU|nr:MarR family transcriptional regulator [Amycolatopsis pithecellobii]MTD52958.1 winged helix DNA-binding protein [Amycolatopsis pithecellobii]
MTKSTESPADERGRTGARSAGEPVPYDLDDNVIRLLLLSFRVSERHLLSRAAEHGFDDIRMTHLPVMRSINVGVARMTEIAELTHITKQTAGALVLELEEMGYLARVPDPRDRRAKILRFTKRGKAFMTRFPDILQQTERDLVEIVGADDLDGLTRILRTIVRSAGGDTPSTAAP